MAEGTLRVMLIDDHAVVRMGFRLLIEGTADIRVVAEAESGEDACQRYAEARPDVVVLDLSMPGMGGLDVIARLLAKDPGARVLVLSAHDDIIHPQRALRAGALGYLSKRSAPDVLIAAIRQVAHRKTYLEPEIAQRVAVRQIAGDKGPVDVLTPREFSVFLALAKGETVAGIAETMSLSPRTVGTHLYSIKHKLGAANSAELTLIAIRSRLIEP